MEPAAVTMIPIGARVRLGADLEAVVLAATVRAGGVSAYEVVWWDGRCRREEWVQAIEIDPVGDAPPARIGFLATADGNRNGNGNGRHR